MPNAISAVSRSANEPPKATVTRNKEERLGSTRKTPASKDDGDQGRLQSLASAARTPDGDAGRALVSDLMAQIQGSPDEALRAASAGLKPDDTIKVRLHEVIRTSEVLGGIETGRLRKVARGLAGNAFASLKAITEIKAKDRGGIQINRVLGI